MPTAESKVLTASADKMLVVLLHGLGNSALIMSPLATYLRRRSFEVLNLGYPSHLAEGRGLSDFISDKLLREYTVGNFDSISIVGFSLGSQLARILISELKDQIKFKRLVMLGPPNQGSTIARWLRPRIPTKRIFGPVFDDLCDFDFPALSKDVETGILAGGLGVKIGLNPFFREDNDGLVTVKETFLDGAKEHKVILSVHGLMPLQPRIMRLVAQFLLTGSFSR